MFYSWKATIETPSGNPRRAIIEGDEEIPNIFGTVYAKIYDGPGKYWEYLTPAAGISSNKPKGANKVAEQECSALVKYKKNYQDCLFDFVAMGKAGVEKNLRLLEKLLQGDERTPDLTTVRDSSGGQMHAHWVGHPNWGCVDGFSSHLSKEFARRESKKHHASMCKCVPGTGEGINEASDKHSCAYRHFVCIADVQN